MMNTIAGHGSLTRWKGLFRAAGAAAVVSEMILILSLVTYYFWPYAPGSMITGEILLLLAHNPVGGLISLDLFLVLGNLVGVVFLFLSIPGYMIWYFLLARAFFRLAREAG